jgi:serine/threonine protein kinase
LVLVEIVTKSLFCGHKRKQKPNNDMTMNATLVATQAGAYAMQQIEHAESMSKLPRRHIQQLQESDIVLTKKVGKGAFGNVYQATIRNGNETDQQQQPQQEQYAVKFLSPGVRFCTATFQAAASDLAIEGDILSRLDHENIIALRGLPSGPVSRSFVDQKMGHFLVLDLLQETLRDRINRWRHERKQERPSALLLQSLRTRQSSLIRRIESSGVLQVAKAMEYLHSNNVVLRDLKPDNVGFTSDGTLKIFDFGFAREVHICQMKEVAGTLHYLAPEYLQGAGCSGLPSDVYSFGVLLWEICTLFKPHRQFRSREKYMDMVSQKGWRPSVRSIPSSALRKIVTACWDENPLNRPTFAQIQNDLQSFLTLNDNKASVMTPSREVVVDVFSSRSARMVRLPRNMCRAVLERARRPEVGCSLNGTTSKSNVSKCTVDTIIIGDGWSSSRQQTAT